MWPRGIYRPFPHDPASLFSVLFLCSRHADREVPQTDIHFLGAPVEESNVLNWQKCKCEMADCTCYVLRSAEHRDLAFGTVLGNREASTETQAHCALCSQHTSKGP